jgi:hypothetical protein
LGGAHVESLADLLRTFNHQNGVRVAYKPFYNRLAVPGRAGRRRGAFERRPRCLIADVPLTAAAETPFMLPIVQAILTYVAAHNEKGTPFTWTKTAADILDKLRRFGIRTQQVHGQ